MKITIDLPMATESIFTASQKMLRLKEMNTSIEMKMQQFTLTVITILYNL